MSEQDQGKNPSRVQRHHERIMPGPDLARARRQQTARVAPRQGKLAQALEDDEAEEQRGRCRHQAASACTRKGRNDAVKPGPSAQAII